MAQVIGEHADPLALGDHVRIRKTNYAGILMQLNDGEGNMVIETDQGQNVKAKPAEVNRSRGEMVVDHEQGLGWQRPSVIGRRR